MEDARIQIDTYHGHMCEAIKSARSYFSLKEHAGKCRPDDPDRHNLMEDSGMQCRYAFLMATNSLEAAANALLKGLDISHALYGDLEKLSTLLKFEVVCIASGKKLDRDRDFFGRIKEIVRCRNEFVHPKPSLVPCGLAGDSKTLEPQLRRTKSRGYPLALEYLTPEHTKDAIGDILAFLSWVVFDICQCGIRDGAMALGCKSLCLSGDIDLFAREYGFDIRTFGQIDD